MSVINQMLQDLDARRADDQRKGLPNEVRPLPGRRHDTDRSWLGLGLILLAAASLGGGAWYLFATPLVGLSSPPTPAAVAALPAPVLASGAASAGAALSPTAAEASPTDTGARVFKDDDFPSSLRLSDLLSGSGARASGGREARVAPPPGAGQAATGVTVPSGSGNADKAVEVASAPRVVESTAAEVRPATAPLPSGPVRIEKTPMQPSIQERAEAEYRRGIAAINQGALKEGGDALRQALKLDVQHAAARQLLLRVLLEQRNQDEARAVLEEAVRLQPSRYQWALALARLQVERGDAAAAWQALQASMAVGAGNADYQGLTGNVLQRLGRHRESAEHYRAALRIAPSEGRWWLGLGLALEADGNSAEARQAFLSARSSGTLTSDMAAFVDQRLR